MLRGSVKPAGGGFGYSCITQKTENGVKADIAHERRQGSRI